jgi:hypothetical protein
MNAELCQVDVSTKADVALDADALMVSLHGFLRKFIVANYHQGEIQATRSIHRRRLLAGPRSQGKQSSKITEYSR